jgi:uncharacterized protein YecT (DUF1311 family)
MKYEDIKDFHQRCEEHPDHQSGMISNSMIQERLHEEVDELREYIEQRAWVELTDEEMHECLGDQRLTPVGMEWARKMEQKIKERNT